MKYFKNYFSYFFIVFVFPISTLEAMVPKEDIGEEKEHYSAAKPTPNKDSIIPNKSPIPNTWGVSEKEMEEAFEENEHLVCLMVFGKPIFIKLSTAYKIGALCPYKILPLQSTHSRGLTYAGLNPIKQDDSLFFLLFLEGYNLQ